MIALPAVLASTLFGAVLAVPIRAAGTLAFVSAIAFLAVALAVVRIALGAVGAVALLLALLAVIVRRAA